MGTHILLPAPVLSSPFTSYLPFFLSYKDSDIITIIIRTTKYIISMETAKYC